MTGISLQNDNGFDQVVEHKDVNQEKVYGCWDYTLNDPWIARATYIEKHLEANIVCIPVALCGYLLLGPHGVELKHRKSAVG